MNLAFFVPPDGPCEELDTRLARVAALPILPPFDESLKAFVADFAMAILRDAEARAYPELIVLADFFKASSLERLQRQLPETPGALLLGRGLVFHIAPSNVDSIFLYSSLIALLCGNINWVRISGKRNAQLDFALRKLNQTIANRHPGIAERYCLFTYAHDTAISMTLSRHCHLRVIWGGDASVQAIRAIPLRPTASELCFADRFSLAVLHAGSVAAISGVALEALSTSFLNDTLWFAQQACASPRLVAWIGTPAACEQARAHFWQALADFAPSRPFTDTPDMVMDRFVTLCRLAADPLHQASSGPAFPTRVLIDAQASDALKQLHCGNGLFYEQCFADLPTFLETLTDREQTLTVFGFSRPDLLAALPSLPARAIDRIAPIGHALDFGVVWDGQNLLSAFTRLIAVDI